MNLGLVVLSAENEVFFQASLVTSSALATQFTLPAAGQYTIGVFRMGLVEPEAVAPMSFATPAVLPAAPPTGQSVDETTNGAPPAA